jgi:hypothetical protein
LLGMDFLEPYLLAMQEQAPAMMRELQAAGKLDDHLKAKVVEAHRMYEDLTKGAPKYPNGLVKEPENREAQDQVRGALIEFPNPETASRVPAAA